MPLQLNTIILLRIKIQKETNGKKLHRYFIRVFFLFLMQQTIKVARN